MAAETSSLSLYIRELLSSICWIFHSAKAIFLSVDIAALVEKIEGFLHEMICDFSGFHHRPSFDTLNHSIFVESEKCGGWEGRPESWKKGFPSDICVAGPQTHTEHRFNVHLPSTPNETSNILEQSRRSSHAEKLIHFKVKNLLKSRKSSPMFCSGWQTL